MFRLSRPRRGGSDLWLRFGLGGWSNNSEFAVFQVQGAKARVVGCGGLAAAAPHLIAAPGGPGAVGSAMRGRVEVAAGFGAGGAVDWHGEIASLFAAPGSCSAWRCGELSHAEACCLRGRWSDWWCRRQVCVYASVPWARWAGEADVFLFAALGLSSWLIVD